MQKTPKGFGLNEISHEKTVLVSLMPFLILSILGKILLIEVFLLFTLSVLQVDHSLPSILYCRSYRRDKLRLLHLKSALKYMV